VGDAEVSIGFARRVRMGVAPASQAGNSERQRRGSSEPPSWYEPLTCGSAGCASSVMSTNCGHLSQMEDPLRIHGNVAGDSGIFDVNGNGAIDCQDFQDACFLHYPVPPSHAPDISRDMFHRMQTIHQAEIEFIGEFSPESFPAMQFRTKDTYIEFDPVPTGGGSRKGSRRGSIQMSDLRSMSSKGLADLPSAEVLENDAKRNHAPLQNLGEAMDQSSRLDDEVVSL